MLLRLQEAGELDAAAAARLQALTMPQPDTTLVTQALTGRGMAATLRMAIAAQVLHFRVSHIWHELCKCHRETHTSQLRNSLVHFQDRTCKELTVLAYVTASEAFRRMSSCIRH